jgi:hypothetical protein
MALEVHFNIIPDMARLRRPLLVVTDVAEVDCLQSSPTDKMPTNGADLDMSSDMTRIEAAYDYHEVYLSLSRMFQPLLGDCKAHKVARYWSSIDGYNTEYGTLAFMLK